MTKARTKGQKRRGPKRDARPDVPNIPRERPDDIMRVALEARARLSCYGGPIVAMKATCYGSNAGRAIAAAGCDIPAMMQAIQRVHEVYSRYISAIEAPSPYPKGMNLELAPEEFGSDGVEVDLGGWDGRTEEERVKGAMAAMMHMDAVLGRAGYGVAHEVKAVVLRDERVRFLDRLIAGLVAVGKDA